MIIKKLEKTKEIYCYAAEKGWVMPCFCSENQTTTEAIFSAAEDYRLKNNISVMPVIIALTVNYPHRMQAKNYSRCNDYKTGLKLFLGDIEALAGDGGVYKDLSVMVHLDHIQPELDGELLRGDLSAFSSIMYDASAFPFEENIRRTAEFVKQSGGKIFIEGACDEIVDASGTKRNKLTSPNDAKRYMDETGVDMIVANLGTEHRAAGAELKYHGDLARDIKRAVGGKIVLHGTSSVSNDQLKALYRDGICKVNIWTALERDTAPDLFYDMVINAEKTAGGNMVKRLIEEGYLTPKCLNGDKINIEFFTEKHRQGILYERMKEIVTEYYRLWYK